MAKLAFLLIWIHIRHSLFPNLTIARIKLNLEEIIYYKIVKHTWNGNQIVWYFKLPIYDCFLLTFYFPLYFQDLYLHVLKLIWNRNKNINVSSCYYYIKLMDRCTSFCLMQRKIALLPTQESDFIGIWKTIK